MWAYHVVISSNRSGLDRPWPSWPFRSTPGSDLHPGSLCIANSHISWIDILALNAARPMAFVSKAEVRTWPVIGWLAEKGDTVFLRRGSRGHARVVNAEIDTRLRQGRDVAVFPEGTTTEGTHLPALFTPHCFNRQSKANARSTSRTLLSRYAGARNWPGYVGDTSFMGVCAPFWLRQRCEFSS